MEEKEEDVVSCLAYHTPHKTCTRICIMLVNERTIRESVRYHLIAKYMNKRPCKKNIPFVLFSQKPLLHNTAVPLPLLHNLFPFYFTKTIPFIDFFFLYL